MRELARVVSRDVRRSSEGRVHHADWLLAIGNRGQDVLAV